MKVHTAIILLGLGVFAVSSCIGTLPNSRIKEQQIPTIYPNPQNTSASSASISWRTYFNDSLLTGLIDTAINGNIDLALAIQRVEIARAQVTQTSGRLLPEVTMGTSAAIRKFGRYTMDGAGNISTDMTPGKIVPIHLPDYFIAPMASWEVDIWGKLKAQKKSSVARLLASEEGVKLIQSALVADIAVAYYELTALDNELEIVTQTIEKEQEALNVILSQKEAGRANELAVQQFKAQLLMTQAMKREISHRILIVENRINFLIGRYPIPIYRNKNILYDTILLDKSVGLPGDLLKYRPDVRAAEYELKASKWDVDAARKAFYPSLMLNGHFGYQAFHTSFWFSTPTSIAYSAFAGLSMPLINRSALKARYREAGANQLSALYRFTQALLLGYIEVVNELNNIENLENISRIRREQSELLTQSITTSSELYRSARANYLEILLAQQNALQANLEFINSHRRAKIAGVQLYRALGGGWQ